MIAQTYVPVNKLSVKREKFVITNKILSFRQFDLLAL